MKIVRRAELVTLDNQPAWLHDGWRLPTLRTTPTRAGSSSIAAARARSGSISAPREGGSSTSVAYEEVGLIVGIWPRISPNGTVTMEINVEKSAPSPAGQDVTAGLSAEGKEVRMPRIERTSLKTTVKVADGESATIGGLAVESGPHQSRLVVVVTPHILSEK